VKKKKCEWLKKKESSLQTFDELEQRHLRHIMGARQEINGRGRAKAVKIHTEEANKPKERGQESQENEDKAKTPGYMV